MMMSISSAIMFLSMWNVDLVLRGPHTQLRAICEEDAALIVRWRNRADVKRNLYTQDDLTIEEHLGWYRGKVLTGQCAQFIIIAQGMPVGTAFLKSIDSRSHKAEFGIFIGEASARGQGFGGEAARLILSYGFRALGLNRIYLTVFSDNFAAIASYRYAGFMVEGVLRQDFRRNDAYIDVTIMSILREDWKEPDEKPVLEATRSTDLNGLDSVRRNQRTSPFAAT